MATYYLAQGGTAANKEAATSGIYPTGCMALSIHNAASFAIGDRINVIADGGAFRSQLLVPSSGTESSPIIYDFDSDVALVGGPLVTGWTVYSGSVWQASIASTVYDVYLDLTQGSVQGSIGACTSEGDWYYSGGTLYLYAPSDPDTAYTSPGVEAVTVNHTVYLNGKNWVTLNGNGAEVRYASENGMYFRITTGSVIDNFRVHDIRPGHGGAYYCVRTHRCDDFAARKIEAYKAGWNGFSIGQLWDTADSNSGFVFEDCYIHDNSHNGLDICPGVAGATISDIAIRRCRVYNNSQNGIYLRSVATNTQMSNVEISYCISYGNGRCGLSLDAYSGGLFTSNAKVYNNTLARNGWETSQASGQGIVAAAIASDFKNNICFDNNTSGDDQREVYINDGGGTANTMDYNLVYHPTSTNVYYWDGSNYTAANIYSSTGQQQHGIHENPDFIDPDNGNFILRSDSPCIGAGVHLGATYDDGVLPGSTWPSGVTTGNQGDY